MYRFRLIANAMTFSVTIFITTHAADAQLVNRFGNLVAPIAKIAAPGGIPGISDNGATGSAFPVNQIDVQDPLDLQGVLDGLAMAIDAIPVDLDNEDFIEELVRELDVIADVVSAKTDRGANSSSTGRVVSVNNGASVAGVAAAAEALGELNDLRVVSDDDVRLAMAVIADADPFVILTGSITNTSETQPLNVFLPFEEAFLDPIPLDAPLLRETFISTELRDTDGDGDASLRAAGLSFQIQATTDPDNPSLANTDPIGVSERLGLPRLRNPGVEFFLTDEATAVDNSLFVSQRAQISHATGELILEELSPGDTVDFTAILSLGIEGDPLTPLIPTQSLRSLVLGAEFVASATVPEPSSGLLVAFTSATLLMGRRDGRQNA